MRSPIEIVQDFLDGELSPTAMAQLIERYGDQRAAEERERIARLCDELARIFVAEDAPHSAAVAVLCGDTIRSAPTPAADRG